METTKIINNLSKEELKEILTPHFGRFRFAIIMDEKTSFVEFLNEDTFNDLDLMGEVVLMKSDSFNTTSVMVSSNHQNVIPLSYEGANNVLIHTSPEEDMDYDTGRTYITKKWYDQIVCMGKKVHIKTLSTEMFD